MVLFQGFCLGVSSTVLSLHSKGLFTGLHLQQKRMNGYVSHHDFFFVFLQTSNLDLDLCSCQHQLQQQSREHVLLCHDAALRSHKLEASPKLAFFWGSEQFCQIKISSISFTSLQQPTLRQALPSYHSISRN